MKSMVVDLILMIELIPKEIYVNPMVYYFVNDLLLKALHSYLCLLHHLVQENTNVLEVEDENLEVHLLDDKKERLMFQELDDTKSEYWS
jgi:hypothetical protein